MPQLRVGDSRPEYERNFTMNTLNKLEKNPEVVPAKPDYTIPEVDILETKDEYLLQADMPGVAKDDLEVLLEGNDLTIVGHRRQALPAGDVLVAEIEPRDYRRSFVLDPMIDGSRITARIEHGVLTVQLPKAEAVKPRRIKITD
jgi:HSP20 family protein